MRTRLRTIPVLLAMLLFGACDNDSVPEQASDAGDWSGAVAVGDAIRVANVSGSIRAVRASSSTSTVEWSKEGDVDDLADVQILVTEDEDGVLVRAEYPSRSVNVEVDFEIAVPEGVDLIVQHISGAVEAIDLGSDVAVTLVSGSVVVETERAAEVNLVSGVAEVAMRSIDWGRDLTFLVQSGVLTVTIPSNSNASVTASVVSGSIATEFSLSGSASYQEGTLGSGEHDLNLSVISGELFLLSGPPA